MTNTSGGTTTTSSLLVRPTAPIIPNNNPVNSKNDSNERKRGPGRPPGSTKQNIEQQRQLQQQHQSLQQQIQPLQGGDLVKHKDGVLSQPMNKKAKVDFEAGPPPNLTSTPQHQHQQQQQPGHNPTVTGNSATSPKLNIDMGQGNPLKWDVKQVCDFVKNLPGCSDYVEDFQLQEIDGQALMLLKAEHLMQAMAMKLGPALKIYNAITALHEQQKQNWRRAHRKRVLFKLGSKLVGQVDVVEEHNNNNNKSNNNSNNEENSGDSSGNDSMLSRASVYDEIFSQAEGCNWQFPLPIDYYREKNQTDFKLVKFLKEKDQCSVFDLTILRKSWGMDNNIYY